MATRFYLDDQMIAADLAAAERGELCVLDGLKINWGRSDTYAQPEPSTLSATLRLEANTAAARAVVESLRPGRSVSVQTDARADEDVRSDILKQPTGGTLHPFREDGEHREYSPARTFPTSGDELERRIGRVMPGQTWTFTATFASYRLGRFQIAIHPLITEGPRAGAVDTSITLASRSVYLGGQDHGYYLWEHSVTWTAPTTGELPRHVGVSVTRVTAGRVTWQSTARWNELRERTWHSVRFSELREITLTADRESVTAKEIYRGTLAQLTAKENRTGTLLINLTAADVYRDLANTPVGDTPWPVHTPGERINRILELATAKPADVDDGAYRRLVFENWRVGPRDTDNTIAAELLAEVTVSLGAVLWLWETPHGRIEGRLDRPAERSKTTGWGADTRPTLEIPASHFWATDLELTRDPSNSVSIVRVTYPGINAEGEQAQVTAVYRDEARLAEIGPRSMSVTVHLTGGSYTRDRLGKELLARSPSTGWQVNKLTYDTRLAGSTDTLLELLEPGRREARRIRVTGIKTRWPIAPDLDAYVEGGEAEFHDGQWRIALTVLPPIPIPPRS